MRKLFSAVFGIVTLVSVAQRGWTAEPVWNYSVQVSATVQSLPPQIALSWSQDTVATPTSYTVYRKAPGATSWGNGTTLPGTQLSYVDASVVAGTVYEYRIVKAASGYNGFGYIQAGVNAPLVENRGKLVLIVDNTYAVQLAAELTRLQQDLTGDGWTVLRHDVNRNDSVVSVKNFIKADYNADPANVKSVFLFGHVPVPYSGQLNPDGHPDHVGAWPADVFYGDMDGNWTDTSVNYTQTVNTDAADAARLTNIPGDGKFDQTTIPSAVELQVGRVDLANMPGRLVWGGPATFPSELELLRQYLTKDHNFRHKLLNVQRRGLVGDYFGSRNGEAFSSTAHGGFAAFFGKNNITDLNVQFSDLKGVWIPTLAANDYLWAYGCGAGSYWTIGGLGTTGLYNDGSAVEIVNNNVRAIFTMVFGSWHGDWDHEDNIMRSILATRDYGLTAAWSGRPHWFVHPMGLGETIGYTARLTQNNTSLYQNQINSSANSIHIALMGDPTLRMHPVAPPGTLSGSTNASNITLNWTASPDSVLGYHVYRSANPFGSFTRLTGSLVSGNSFVDTNPMAGTNTYQVRAVKLESSASGTYTNASQGIFWTTGTAIAQGTDNSPPTVSLSAPANNATVSGSSVTVSASAADNIGVVGMQFKLDGNNLDSEDLVAPFSATWNTTTAANGPHTLTAVARDLAGNQTTASTISVNVSNAAASTVVWFDDALPAGASGMAFGGDAWTWVSGSPLPFSGALAHQSTITPGLHEHYFNWATATLTVSAGENLFAYVYLDPANPPSEIMLGWNDSAGSWEHRAYWGANSITYGADGTAGRYYMGTLPPAGQWVRLEVPASVVNLEGATLQGMDFAQFNGRATWDYVGKSTQSTPAPTLPTVTVAASDTTATIGTSDNGVFTFTRTGSTVGSLVVNYTLGGSAMKWNDYRTPAGDMPVSVTIPAGVSAYALNIVAVTNSTGANPLTVNLALAPDAAYNVGLLNIGTVTIAGSTTATNPPPPLNTNPPPTISAVNYTTLEMPKIGDNGLNILSPTLLELHLINTKPSGGSVTSWNFVDASGNLALPATSQFVVTVDGVPNVVQAVGFKRRPLYAPLAQRDLRIDNCLYLKLATPVANNRTVTVVNPGGLLWGANVLFSQKADPLRYSPVIHVNQEGYVPSFPKKAQIGYYLGSMGEMINSAGLGFSLVDATTGATVYQGNLIVKLDLGYTYTPAPYQNVLQADFSSFTTPGEYRLVVPGLGASLPFLINDGVAMAFARAYELGLYHQRCGGANSVPFTRFTHDACHTAQASVPMPQASFGFTWNCVSNYAIIPNADGQVQTAPRLTGPSTQLYPFVRTGTLDASGGHHDAGDYSKYTINSTILTHDLMFAVDSLSGVAALDNLGIPESGDGISDILQEAKWEADYLTRIQDNDGGFYFLTYPQNREYESNVLPDRGDQQVVWPKTTSASASAVAALAQCASSPLMKQKYPAAAALYLQKAQLGWQFLTNAIARYGKNGAYQKITHYGDDFLDQDELAWAACEMFLATGDQTIHQTLKSWFPDPTSTATFRWGWWRQYACYGNAVRSYAFAVRSGRLSTGQIDSAYLAKCITTVTNAGNDALAWSQQGAYGSSFPDATKRVRGAGWYFSASQAFDIAVAYQISARPEYLEAMVANMNFEGGANPVNVTYVTGLGWKRQREIVDQYSQNDRHVLPKSGIPLASIQQGFVYVGTYGTELSALTYPSDDAGTAPYPYYDRWGDAFNVTTEFVVTDQGRGLGTLAFLATLTPLKTQAWTSATAQITGLPSQVSSNTAVTASLQLPAGMNLSGARIVWEAQGQQPAYGTSFTFTPSGYGDQWVEAEVQWPDGRRVVAVTNLFAENGMPTVSISSTDTVATEGATDAAAFTLTRSGSTASALVVTLQPTGTATKWNDYRRPQGDMPDTWTIPAGSSSVTITVNAVDDAEVESTETTTLTIQPNTNYNVGTPYYVTLTIYDKGSTPPADTTVPTVSMTSPVNNATVSGTTVTVSASAADNVGVVGVQFKLDGTNLGTENTGAPYSAMLNSTNVANGPHTLTAVARDAAGNQATATSVTIVVSNSVVVTLPAITVAVSDANASRIGLDPGMFTITRTGSTTGALTVNYTLGGVAVNGTDYNALGTSVTIPAGAASTTITVTPKSGTSVVGAETVSLTLSANAAYLMGSSSNATITIAGNTVPSSIRKVASNMQIIWNSSAGKVYRVAHKTNLTDANWTDLSGNITAANTITSFTDSTTGNSKSRYYVVYVTN